MNIHPQIPNKNSNHWYNTDVCSHHIQNMIFISSLSCNIIFHILILALTADHIYVDVYQRQVHDPDSFKKNFQDCAIGICESLWTYNCLWPTRIVRSHSTAHLATSPKWQSRKQSIQFFALADFLEYHIYCVVLKFGRHLCSFTAEMPAKFENNTMLDAYFRGKIFIEIWVATFFALVMWSPGEQHRDVQRHQSPRG